MILDALAKALGSWLCTAIPIDMLWSYLIEKDVETSSEPARSWKAMSRSSWTWLGGKDVLQQS
jgi:hypothetical protein